MPPLLETLGEASVSRLWVPVAAWTVLSVVADLGVRRWARRAPEMAYRLVQSVLLALPLGLAVALLVDPSWLPAWRSVTLPLALPASGPAPEASPVTPLVNAPAVTLGLVLGVATLVAVVVGAVALARLGVQALRVRRLRRALPEVEDASVVAEVAALSERSGLHPPPQVLVTSAEVAPMTLGVVRPTVVVPASLGASDRRLALAHEIQHVRRADPLGHTVEAIIAALFAAHPVVTGLAQQCDLYREMACDTAVLASAGVDRRAYASLVSDFAISTEMLRAPTAVSMAARLPHVHQRLLTMTQPISPRASRFASLSALAALLAGVLLMTAGRAVAQPARVVVEGPDKAVVYVDGERFEGSFEDIDPGAILTVDVLKSDAAGADDVVRITTRAGAAEGAFTPVESGERIELRLSGPVALVEPLVIIDGEVVEGSEALETIDPSDIATVDVLKGPEAVEAYGAAAADGVVRVTTTASVRQAAASTERAVSALTLDVRPNPAMDVVELSLTAPEAGDVRLDVYDAAGRLVRTRAHRADAGVSTARIDVSDLAVGTYIVRVATEDGGRAAALSASFSIVR